MMAEKRYSPHDQQKMVQDGLAELRARGVDAREIRSFHPQGDVGAVREMLREVGATRDQTQQQNEETRNRIGMRGKS